MKRPQHDCSDSAFLDDYVTLTSLYDLQVVKIKNKGKGVIAKRSMSADMDILEELPLAVWPIKLPSGPIKDIFCENCLHFLPYDGDTTCHLAEKVSSFSPQIPSTSGSSNCAGCLNILSSEYDTVASSSNERITSRNKDYGQPDTYFCCDTCTIQGLGAKNAADSRNVSAQDSCFRKHLSLSNVDSSDSTIPSVGGWLEFLSADALHTLRRRQREVDPMGDCPITLEAFGRIISRIVAISVQMYTEFHLSISESYTIAWRSYERLFPSQNLSLIDFNFERAHEILSGTLGDKIENTLGELIRTHLLSLDTLQLIMEKLILNCQSLNIWGAAHNGELTVLRAAGVYVLQSCFNHSCDPNCTISCMWDSTITITTLRPIAEGEELTIAYIPTELSLAERKNLLLNYLFYCSCSKCLYEEKQVAAATDLNNMLLQDL
ncbi:putative histone lysine methyltransferase, SET [Cardiosporidium cionae]|uniref:Histone lysine methyltransferase, SET n=1 Tax=Cardiosporidium cionae TaxID=476202 RepID=A0ABQ7J4T8_9APIC|nr:putative histone lysine methyltransferase, SET [Cardiosporidium cionae]|eukprot:KAF8819041.1 putative histone lysine methyltransferase, SET [Cardiosporidium cionae]